ncbi:hypothetical protein ACJMK2_042776, partial [Sinanodonta woodiana]
DYLFTMPHSLRGGSQGKYCLTLSHLGNKNPAGYNCQVSLQFLTSERSIREHIYAFNSTESDWSECVNFDAPNKEDQYTASITVHIDGKKLFSHEKTVDVWTAKNITLIQTDKPQYKPGQTVKFRILRMDYRMLPLTDLFELITIDNPGGVRVMQWKNVDASKGLVSLEMKLSDDPVLGTWNIKVHGADETIQSFKVKEYVLPRFQMKITPPKYILPTTKSIMGKVCAHYTYGQPVKGSLTMKVCFGPEPYPSYYYYKQPCVDIIEKNFDGCHFFSILPSQLKLGEPGYPTGGFLKINATVHETATGMELNRTSTGPPLTYDPLKIEMSDESDGYFKPRFPYKGKVTVTLPDGNPASNEVIRIKAEKYSLQYYWSREFTTDSSGIINFSLSNLGQDVYSLSLSATAVNYEKQTEMGSGLRISTPKGHRTITQWFSPSLSYIYIPTIKDKVPCDSTVDLDVLYSTDGSSVNVFNFVVKSGDDIIHVARKNVVYVDTHLDILQLHPDEELKYHANKLTDDVDPVVLDRIGYFKMPVPIKTKGLDVTVLVYYINRNSEVVAATLQIPVDRCFKNKSSKMLVVTNAVLETRPCSKPRRYNLYPWQGTQIPTIQRAHFLPLFSMEVRMKETKDFRIQSVSGAILKLCVCGSESKSAKFHIVPLKVGEIDLEVMAVSIEDDTTTCVNQIISKDGIGVQDGVRRKLLVEPEGIPQEYTKSFYLCPEGRLLSQDIDLPVAGDDKIVPDSQRAKVNVIGDIMGPTLSNLKDLLKMPYGCGEQNMASWSPNIYVLQYLTNTNQLTDAIQEEAKGYMRVGYQRQLKYRNHDGSYSAWGDNKYQNSTGSTWLTAFVVKSMAQSRPFIDIDSKDLNFSMQWLLKHQNRDGCIHNVGKVFSSYLTGGLADGENVGGLTAFTLIALIEAGIDKNDTVVALQALSMYATLVYQGGLDLSVRVDTPSKSYQTGINDSNSLVLTTWDLSPQTTKVNVQVHGKGCAMIQANMKYNIYKDEENETGQASFEVKVNVYRSRIDIDTCKKRTLRICVRQ